jgi:hypothetical protein
MNLYVSNLAYTVSDDDLRRVFEVYGAVISARVITDRETGRSRGFGFVEMPDDQAATAALNDANNQDLSGRPMKIVEARPKEARPQAGGGGRSFVVGGGGGGARRDFDGGRRDQGGGGGRDRDRGWDRERDRGDRGSGGRDRGDRGGRRGGYEDEGW